MDGVNTINECSLLRSNCNVQKWHDLVQMLSGIILCSLLIGTA